MALPVGTQASVNSGPALLLQGAALLDAPRALPAGSPVTPPSPNHLALGLRSAEDPPPAPPPLSRAPTAPPSVEAHGVLWRKRVVTQLYGGPLRPRLWSVRTLGGDFIREGGDSVGFDRTRAPIDYLFAVDRSSSFRGFSS